MNRRDALLAVASTALSAMARNAFGRSRDAQHDFIVVGDWGRDSTKHQHEVALQMAKTAARLGCSHVISVGENFYENGVQSVTDPQ